MAKGVTQFVLRKSFAYIAGDGIVDDFRERLFVDVSKRNLSAMIEAAGDNATVMKNCDMGIKRTASANNDFAVRSFDVASIDALLRMTQGQ